MYLQHFGLTEAPFSITPDPAFVYLSGAHREALAHLLYGVGQGGSGGFVQLTGEVGTGKTTICRCLLEQVPDNTLIALILNPLVTPKELLASICEELDVDISQADGSGKKMVDALTQYLLEQYANGKRVVVVIDEAQNLSPEALEQVRLLTNIETAKHKLLQMVLLGQPELRQLLQRQNLRQLAQRITARYHLAPLNEEETFAYIKHRMRVAGARQSHFNPSALRAIYRRSAGVPRLINIIADRALAGAYALEKEQVTAKLVHSAANEVQPSESRVATQGIPTPVAVSIGLASVLVLLLFWQQERWMNWFDSVNGSEATKTAKSAEQKGGESPDTALGVATQAEGMSSPLGAATMTDLSASAQSQDTHSSEAVGNLDYSPTVSLPLRDPAWSYEKQADLQNELQGELQGDMQGDMQREGQLLSAEWLSDQHLLAYPALAQLWHEEDKVKDLLLACDGVVAAGFACLTEHGNWAKVKRLGLPVILVLQSDGEKHVLLRGIDGQRIQLGAGSRPQSFGRDQVDELWMGEYIVAWPQSADWPAQIRRGDNNAAVNIVFSMAALANPPWQGNNEFDLKFENWIKDFQKGHGLPDDGIIGPQTLLYLMAPGISEPRLALQTSGEY